MKIDEFDGQYRFLSNFFMAPIEYDGFTFSCSEAAYQAMKSLDRAKRAEFVELDAFQAKRKGRSVKMRKDWEEVKDQVMYDICLAKFSQHDFLKEKLLKTGEAELIEGNHWGDIYWGVCKGRGKNQLGKTLMRIREEIK